MEKGISGCSTLTKLSLRDLPLSLLLPKCASASVRAAMALQSSLTEVEWSRCSFSRKSNIGVTVLACCVWCVGGRVCVYFACVYCPWCALMHVCVCVSFEMYLHCVCPSLVNVATLQRVWVHRCVGSESARVHVHLLQISFTFLWQAHF